MMPASTAVLAPVDGSASIASRPRWWWLTAALASRPVPPPAAGGRTRWADVAKGVCILLVVLWHVIMKHYLQIDWQRLALPIPGAWGFFGDLLLPLRMPLFFMISGMFALSAVHRPWRLVARSRVAKFCYLYVVWLLIHTTLLGFTPDFHTDKARSLPALLEQLTITPSNLWYLFALAVYFVIAKVSRGVPMTVMAGAALLLSVATAAGALPTPGNRAGLLQNLVFFLAGLYLRPLIERLAGAANWRLLAVTAIGYAALMGAITVLGARQVPGVWTLASLVATVTGVIAAALAARWRRLTDLLSGLGRNTLPIYVIHMPVLALLHRPLHGPLSHAGAAVQLAAAILEPVLLTALIVAICGALYGVLRRLRAGWLFELPTRRAPARHRATGGARTSYLATVPAQRAAQGRVPPANQAA